MEKPKTMPKAARRTGSFLRYIKKEYLLYLMMVPGLLYFIIFKYAPMYGASIAFRDYNIFQGIGGSPWVGFRYFAELFSQEGFLRALYNNVIISVLKLVFGFPIPIIISLMINEITHRHYKKFVQTSVILPNFVSWVVVYGLLYAMLSPNFGALKDIAALFHLNGELPNLLSDKSTFRSVIVWSHIWKSAGMGTIVYLAAISNIDLQLYEAAVIDGANKWKQLLHVTLPCLRSTIVVLLLFRVGEVMYAGFDQIFAITNPLVNSVADIIDTYVYRVGLQNQQFSLATAAGLFQSAIGLVLVLVTNFIAKKLDPDSGLI